MSRTVGSDGCVMVDLHTYYVSQRLAGQRVALVVDAPERCFAVWQGTALFTRLATEREGVPSTRRIEGKPLSHGKTRMIPGAFRLGVSQTRLFVCPLATMSLPFAGDDDVKPYNLCRFVRSTRGSSTGANALSRLKRGSLSN